MRRARSPGLDMSAALKCAKVEEVDDGANKPKRRSAPAAPKPSKRPVRSKALDDDGDPYAFPTEGRCVLIDEQGRARPVWICAGGDDAGRRIVAYGEHSDSARALQPTEVVEAWPGDKEFAARLQRDWLGSTPSDRDWVLRALDECEARLAAPARFVAMCRWLRQRGSCGGSIGREFYPNLFAPRVGDAVRVLWDASWFEAHAVPKSRDARFSSEIIPAAQRRDGVEIACEASYGLPIQKNLTLTVEYVTDGVHEDLPWPDPEHEAFLVAPRLSGASSRPYAECAPDVAAAALRALRRRCSARSGENTLRRDWRPLLAKARDGAFEAAAGDADAYLPPLEPVAEPLTSKAAKASGKPASNSHHKKPSPTPPSMVAAALSPKPRPQKKKKGHDDRAVQSRTRAFADAVATLDDAGGGSDDDAPKAGRGRRATKAPSAVASAVARCAAAIRAVARPLAALLDDFDERRPGQRCDSDAARAAAAARDTAGDGDGGETGADSDDWPWPWDERDADAPVAALYALADLLPQLCELTGESVEACGALAAHQKIRRADAALFNDEGDGALASQRDALLGVVAAVNRCWDERAADALLGPTDAMVGGRDVPCFSLLPRSRVPEPHRTWIRGAKAAAEAHLRTKEDPAAKDEEPPAAAALQAHFATPGARTCTLSTYKPAESLKRPLDKAPDAAARTSVVNDEDDDAPDAADSAPGEARKKAKKNTSAKKAASTVLPAKLPQAQVSGDAAAERAGDGATASCRPHGALRPPKPAGAAVPLDSRRAVALMEIIPDAISTCLAKGLGAGGSAIIDGDLLLAPNVVVVNVDEAGPLKGERGVVAKARIQARAAVPYAGVIVTDEELALLLRRSPRATARWLMYRYEFGEGLSVLPYRGCTSFAPAPFINCARGPSAIELLCARGVSADDALRTPTAQPAGRAKRAQGQSAPNPKWRAWGSAHIGLRVRRTVYAEDGATVAGRADGTVIAWLDAGESDFVDDDGVKAPLWRVRYDADSLLGGDDEDLELHNLLESAKAPTLAVEALDGFDGLERDGSSEVESEALVQSNYTAAKHSAAKQAAGGAVGAKKAAKREGKKADAKKTDDALRADAQDKADAKAAADDAKHGDKKKRKPLQANCQFLEVTDADAGAVVGVFVVATRALQAGEALLVKYGREFWGGWSQRRARLEELEQCADDLVAAANDLAKALHAGFDAAVEARDRRQQKLARPRDAWRSLVGVPFKSTRPSRGIARWRGVISSLAIEPARLSELSAWKPFRGERCEGFWNGGSPAWPCVITNLTVGAGGGVSLDVDYDDGGVERALPLTRARPRRSATHWKALPAIEAGTWVRRVAADVAAAADDDASDDAAAAALALLATSKPAKVAKVARKPEGKRREGVLQSYTSGHYNVLCDDGELLQKCDPDDWEPLMVLRYEDSDDQRVVSLDQLRALKPVFLGADGLAPTWTHTLRECLGGAGIAEAGIA
ncbi:hypothetical protein M885DRAFT_621333 [Pelagophyceae sp. CCMP2097]|nr:hypothetical protein M885DRAFT_621333 [Pelagophyceae sp. CCMP2097]